MQIRQIIFLIFIIIVIGYFFYEAEGVIFAPRLDIYEPQNFSTLKSVNSNISGKSDPNIKVWVNGREFIADDKGLFRGSISLDLGYNELGIKVKNRFGKETRKVLQVVVK